MHDLLLAAILFAASGDDVPERPSRQPLALTVSGGVSLGVYMAGYVYVTSELVKRDDVPLKLVLATGASAGSANTLVAAMTSCSPPNPDPMADLGWKVWARADYRELFVPEQVTSTSVFSRRMLNLGIDEMKHYFARGLPETCDLVLGFSATRVEPYEVELAKEFSVPRLAERFSFRLRGRGLGKVPRLTNYVDPKSAVEQPLLPFSKGPRETDLLANFERVREVMLASGAFPFAFAPQTIAHCLSSPYTGVTPASLECPEDQVRRDAFIDGGVFDNTPLQFAYDLAQLGLTIEHEDGTWCDLDDEHARADDTGLADRVDYLYLDPGLSVYPPLEDEEDTRPDRLLPLATDTFGTWIRAARSRELYSLVRKRQTLRRHMRLTRVQYPPASEALGAFMGLFDRKFRFFDFYLGMYDATKFFLGWSNRLGSDRRFEDVLPGGQVAENWEPFACMVSVFEPGYERWSAYCEGPELEDFRILVQVDLDVIYAHCGTLEPAPVDSPHYHCARAARGESQPRVMDIPPPESGIVRRAGESHFEHRMRLLEEYRFLFEDLGLRRDQAGLGRVKLRRKLLGMTSALADKQAPIERELVLTASRSAINSIAYEPPKNWWYVAFGSRSELGASLLPFEWNRSFARLNVSLSIDGLLSLLTLETDETVIRATAGPELELLFATTPVFQPLVGTRAGYQIGRGDRFLTESCTGENAEGDGRLCSGFVLEGYGALNIFERFRIQFTASFTPGNPRLDERRLDLGASFGVQFF